MKLRENVLKHHHLERRFLSSLTGSDWDMKTFAFWPFLPWPRVLLKLRLSCQMVNLPTTIFQTKSWSLQCGNVVFVFRPTRWGTKTVWPSLQACLSTQTQVFSLEMVWLSTLWMPGHGLSWEAVDRSWWCKEHPAWKMASKLQLEYEIALVMDSQTKDMAGESVCYEERPNQWEFFYITREGAERVRRVNGFIG